MNNSCFLFNRTNTKLFTSIFGEYTKTYSHPKIIHLDEVKDERKYDHVLVNCLNICPREDALDWQ